QPIAGLRRFAYSQTKRDRAQSFTLKIETMRLTPGREAKYPGHKSGVSRPVAGAGRPKAPTSGPYHSLMFGSFSGRTTPGKGPVPPNACTGIAACRANQVCTLLGGRRWSAVGTTTFPWLCAIRCSFEPDGRSRP